MCLTNLLRSEPAVKTNLDHLVVAARDLDAGREYISEMLGVDVPIGGEHKMMGTHNRGTSGASISGLIAMISR